MILGGAKGVPQKNRLSAIALPIIPIESEKSIAVKVCLISHIKIVDIQRIFIHNHIAVAGCPPHPVDGIFLLSVDLLRETTLDWLPILVINPIKIIIGVRRWIDGPGQHIGVKQPVGCLWAG